MKLAWNSQVLFVSVSTPKVITAPKLVINVEAIKNDHGYLTELRGPKF